MNDVINPFEGYPINMTWAQSIADGTGDGECFATPRTYVGVAAADGHAVYNGGEFHEIIITMSNGEGIRYSEGETPLGAFPRDVKMFDPVVANANFRDGEYRSPHMNGIDIHGTRIQFTKMVTETQAEAKAKLVLPANERRVIVNNSRIRTGSTLTAGVLEEVNNDTVLTVDGFTSTGDNVSSNPYWYHVVSPVVGFISATLIEGGMVTTGLNDLSKVTTTPPIAPVTSPPTEVTPPPVTVAPSPVPVTTTPAPAPVVTPPKKVIPVSKTPIIDINTTNAADVGSDLADVAQVAFTPAGRKKLYNVVTATSAVLTPVYALALASAAFFGGQVRDDILIGTGITLVVDKIIGAFTTRLASKNVGI